MSDRSRIPKAIGDFNGYINTTANYLAAGTPTNGSRLGLTTQNISDWAAKRLYWSATLYPKYINPLLSTKAIKDEVKNKMVEFRTFAQPLLNIVAASPNATEADANALNFVLNRAAPTEPNTPIAGLVDFTVETLGGGELQFTCRPIGDGGRASKAEGADSVQVAWRFLDTGTTPNPNPGPDVIPTPSDFGTVKDIFTKMKFLFHAGDVNVGKRIVIFVRWWNTKHPELAGPWSAVRVVVVS